jgi:putative oxidoreductase
MNATLALLRAALGALFIGHGAQKLFGSFGGSGLEGTGQFFESLGLKPGKPMAAASGAAELGGGALVGLGLGTPVGAALISSSMMTAIWKVHRQRGPWVGNGGYEYNFLILCVAYALSQLGPGNWSLDNALGRDLSGHKAALAELGAGALGAAGAIAIGNSGALGGEPEESTAEGEGPPGDPASA